MIIHENLALLKFLLLGDLDFRRIDISFASFGRAMPSLFFNLSAAWLALSLVENGTISEVNYPDITSSEFIWTSSKKSPSSISVDFFNSRISDSLTIRFSVEVFACPDSN